MFKLLLLTLLAYLMYKLIRPVFAKSAPKVHVKGQEQKESDKKIKKNIEDADFEDIDE